MKGFVDSGRVEGSDWGVKAKGWIVSERVG